MQLKQLPRTFCWAKINMDSGEDLATIVLRKEWERRLGGGRFLWGIGQPPSNRAQIASRGGSAIALFSPKSGRRASGTPRGEMLLWNSWIDASGQMRPLPAHTLITSSARLPSGKRREHYYALVCSEPAELRVGYRFGISQEGLRHAGSGRKLGAATATAVVEHRPSADDPSGKRYPLAFAAALEAPFCVKLAQPRRLKGREFAQVMAASREGDFDAYVKLVRQLRDKPAIERTQGFTRDLFDAVPNDSGKPTVDISQQAARFVASVVGRQQRAPQLALF
ncbi:hypothetical protein [Paraburkholderia caribensis]|uniref:hypothetical protein n=1 Tax=Paraburkholderia TaxID=1822464 RepID=UPI001CABE6B5|nr:hypothetical protein [Paraburkholderia caribensis]BEU25805.1 hypothetical protein PBP221_59450 [Paraburkholderia sp. 22B1P]CAG9250960.1 conserved hypothetical protein [Paraburkholderia caribensis]